MTGTSIDEEVDLSGSRWKVPIRTSGMHILDEACGDDARLACSESKCFSRPTTKPESFLEGTPSWHLPATLDQPITEKPGTVIGRYKLLEQIGEGGFGVVFMAEQEEPVRRKVALKIIKPGMDTKEVIARFEAERQALAIMDHPNIAKVLDAGATESGRPYFVMELVRGIPITDFCDQNSLTDPGAAGAVSSRSARLSNMPIRRESSIATSSRRTCWSRCATTRPCPR